MPRHCWTLSLLVLFASVLHTQNTSNSPQSPPTAGSIVSSTAPSPDLLQRADALDKQANEADAKAQQLEQQASRSRGAFADILNTKNSFQAKDLRNKASQYREQAQQLRAQAGQTGGTQSSMVAGSDARLPAKTNLSTSTGAPIPVEGWQALDHQWCSISYPKEWKAYKEGQAVILTPEERAPNYSRSNSRPPKYGLYISNFRNRTPDTRNVVTESTLRMVVVELQQLYLTMRWGKTEAASYAKPMVLNGFPAQAQEISVFSSIMDKEPSQRGWIIVLRPPNAASIRMAPLASYSLYLLFLAPVSEFEANRATFEKMATSVVVNKIIEPGRK